MAGLLASAACGLGVIPLLIRRLRCQEKIGLGYAYAGGLMLGASVLNLLVPAHTIARGAAAGLVQTVAGVLLGGWLLSVIHQYLTPERLESKWARQFGSRTGILVFLVMAFHSVPEGIAVGVGYASETHRLDLVGLGQLLAIAIAIHNIPEGLAVALPLRAQGTSLQMCCVLAVCSSLPQPLAALPASYMVWCFEPLMLPLLGLAAGAMLFLVIVELIPEALRAQPHSHVAWALLFGFSTMMLAQVLL